ncbi:Co-chaperone [Coemansia javaensis]|uniref:Co-chaperone n=1 Tax=Coemansia javaensis TaxID=2761396 RepID=A0A9W8LH61_9FUNG|nr:Co-chaperone [Coemansia javaensis]
MADWRNVGNWHWKERNCLEWAKAYLEEKLVGLEATGDGITAKVTSLDSATGDADLNIRKGRLLAIYDLEVKLSWKATRGDEEATGRIVVPEVAHDTDEYVYEVTASGSGAAQIPFKDAVRKHLTAAIGARLAKFTDDLKEANGRDMYIPDSSATSGASTPAPAAPAAAGVAAAAADARPAKDGGARAAPGSDGVGVAKTSEATFGTVEISQTAEFMCSTADLFATLTDAQRVAVWTRGPAEIQPAAGTRFKLFGGHIEGEITRVEPGELIEQTWRVATWPAGHYSKVRMELEQLSSSARLSLKQTGVPLNEEDATKANWDRYYWNGIKGSFG